MSLLSLRRVRGAHSKSLTWDITTKKRTDFDQRSVPTRVIMCRWWTTTIENSKVRDVERRKSLQQDYWERKRTVQRSNQEGFCLTIPDEAKNEGHDIGPLSEICHNTSSTLRVEETNCREFLQITGFRTFENEIYNKRSKFFFRSLLLNLEQRQKSRTDLRLVLHHKM